MKKIITCFLLCFLSIGSLIAQVPSYVPTTGLLGWWPFNGNANAQAKNMIDPYYKDLLLLSRWWKNDSNMALNRYDYQGRYSLRLKVCVIVNVFDIY